MDRDEKLKEHRQYLATKALLQRQVDEVLAVADGINPCGRLMLVALSYVTDKNIQIIKLLLKGHFGTAAVNLTTCIKDLNRAVSITREAAARREPYSPVKTTMAETLSKALSRMDEVPHRGKLPSISFNDGSGGVNISMLWLRKVEGEGISVVSGSGATVFVASASKMNSPYLEEEGLQGWDVIAYSLKNKAARKLKGYVVKRDGQKPITVFSESLNAAVKLCQRRVVSAVMREMG